MTATAMPATDVASYIPKVGRLPDTTSLMLFSYVMSSGYQLVCNKIDVSSPPMANLLWLFYISKATRDYTVHRHVTTEHWTASSN